MAMLCLDSDGPCHFGKDLVQHYDVALGASEVKK